MDYFPRPASSLPGIDVPLLAHYALSQDADVESVYHFMEAHPVAFVAAELQAVHFFGLIECLFNRKVDVTEWTRPSTNGPMVRWPLRYIEYLREARCQNGERALAMLRRAYAIFDRIEASNHPGLSHREARTPPFAEVALSIRMLCEVVQQEVLGLESMPTELTEPTRICTDFLHDQLAARGWCRRAIGFLLRESQRGRSGLMMAYYLLTLKRSGLRRVHSICTEYECTANNVKIDNTYSTRHTSSSCICDHVGVSTDSICDIIAKGKIPLVKIETTAGRVRLSIREARPLDRYVAISHVWSEGLDSPAENALPECQLSLLWRRLRALPNGRNAAFYDAPRRWSLLAPTRSFLIWMDTLCIPVRPEDAVLRTRAIDRMNLVYAVADKVLVLDAGLETARIGSSELAEPIAQIAFSTWMTRSWTLQEGFLARDCFFQFIDGAVEPTAYQQIDQGLPFRFLELADCSRIAGRREGTRSTWRLQTPATPSGIEYRLFELFRGTVNYLAVKPADALTTSDFYGVATLDVRYARFTNIWNCLAMRSTSMQSDLYLSFANLLQYSTGPIAAAPVHDRMRVILAMTEKLPLGLLYNAGPRIANGFERWIPISPSSSLIRGAGTMRFAQNSLWLDSAHIPETVVILLATGLQRSDVLYIRCTAEGSTRYLRLATGQSQTDKPDERSLEEVCYVFDEELMRNHEKSTGSRRHTRLCAARLSVLPGDHETIWHGFDTQEPTTEQVSIKAVYECPVEARWLPGDTVIPPGPGVLVVESEDLRHGIRMLSARTCHWRIEIDFRKRTLSCTGRNVNVTRESANQLQQLVQRPELENREVMTGIRSTYHILTMFLLWQVHIVSGVLQVVVAAELGWHSTTGLYKATVISAIVGYLAPVFEVAPATMFLVDRLRADALRRIDLALVVTACTVSLSMFFLPPLTFFVVELMLEQALHDAYDERWPEVQGWCYRWTYGLWDSLRKTFWKLGIKSEPSTWWRSFDEGFDRWDLAMMQGEKSAMAWVSNRVSSALRFARGALRASRSQRRRYSDETHEMTDTATSNPGVP